MGSEAPFADFFDIILDRGFKSTSIFIKFDFLEGSTDAALMPLTDLLGVSMHNKHSSKDRICIVTFGKLVNLDDVIWVVHMSTNFITSARSFMFYLDCIQVLKWNKKTSLTGITIHAFKRD